MNALHRFISAVGCGYINLFYFSFNHNDFRCVDCEYTFFGFDGDFFYGRMIWCSSASLETRRYDTILNGIVWNEAEKYWSGERSLDEIIDHIQNRVQLMLEEQK